MLSACDFPLPALPRKRERERKRRAPLTFPSLSASPISLPITLLGRVARCLAGRSAVSPQDRAWAVRNTERLVEELEFYAVHAGALSLYLLHQDGGEGLGRVVLPGPSDRFDILLESVRYCFDRAWRAGKGVTRMHLNAYDLRQAGWVQLWLFDQPAERARAVATVKRQVNARMGRFAVRSSIQAL